MGSLISNNAVYSIIICFGVIVLWEPCFCKSFLWALRQTCFPGCYSSVSSKSKFFKKKAVSFFLHVVKEHFFQFVRKEKIILKSPHYGETWFQLDRNRMKNYNLHFRVLRRGLEQGKRKKSWEGRDFLYCAFRQKSPNVDK